MPSEEPLPQEEQGYYNLKDSSRGIPAVKPPENSSPDVCEESDEDDREYYNSNLKCWLSTGKNPEVKRANNYLDSKYFG